MMLKLTKQKLDKLRNNFGGQKIAIIGDMMLDCYFRGDVKRVSPEAPVPVVEVENEFFRFGGAANVALNILKLGGVPIPIGVIGNDNDGRIFTSLLNEADMIFDGLIEYLSSTIHHLQGIILQDYNKGVLTKTFIKNIIELANKKNVLVTVDPKFNNFFEYKNVTVFKPNKKEAEDILGMKIKSNEDITKAGRTILERSNALNVLLTLGAEGIAVFEKDKTEKRMETKARKVADVSGAGDTVISTLTMALAAGGDIIEASYLANYAAGIVCEEVGIVPIEIEKLFDAVEKDNK